MASNLRSRQITGWYQHFDHPSYESVEDTFATTFVKYKSYTIKEVMHVEKKSGRATICQHDNLASQSD